ENTVQRMQLAQVPVTPYVPRMLAVPGLQDRLLSRFASLMQGPFSPEQMTACLDSLLERYGTALMADHERWGMELNEHPEPTASADHLRKFVERRPAGMMEYLAIATGRQLIRLRTTCEPEEGGSLTLEGVPASPRSQQFAGTPLTITAVANEGWEFAGWKRMEEGSAVVVVDPAHQRQMRAMFRKAGSRADLP
ncbi:MAG: CotH kinase family protein, partial [Flavobacteriales bacterium]|nr:CotH kinase family protein [Flavobacteriales bacterium]